MEISRVKQKGITLVIMTELRKVPEASFLYEACEPLLLLQLLFIIIINYFSSRNSPCFQQDRKQKHRKTMTQGRAGLGS